MIKESAAGTKTLNISGWAEKLTAGAMQVAVAAVGFLLSRVSLLGGMWPLGVAFTAGAEPKYIISSAIGSFLGYLLPLKDRSALTYAAALLAVASIRLLINGLKGIGKSTLWSGLVAAVVMLGVNLVSAVGRFAEYGAFGIAEGLLSGAAAYVLRRAGKINRKAQSLTPEQTACLLISVNLILISLAAFQFDGISLGRILTFAVILFSARYGRVSVSAVAGISAACTFLLAGQSATQSLLFCIAGLVSGLVAGLGRYVPVAALLTVSGIWAALSRASEPSLSMLIEVGVAGIMFVLTPKSALSGLTALLSPPAVTPDTKGLRRTLTMRLGFASAALHGVSDTVEDVARCLAVSSHPSFAAVLQNTEQDACKGCSFHMYCWEKQRKVTEDAVLSLADSIRQCRPLTLADLPEAFSERCLRIERFEDSVSKHYSSFLSQIAAERRVTELRGVVSDQMNGIADMLAELSAEFQTAQKYDIALAGRVAAALKELDLRANECSCVVDKFGRLTVEIKLFEEPEIPINRMRILERLQSVCDRDFEPPEINRVGRTYYITATEKAVFSVECACTQFNQGRNQHCGDTCKYFFDGRGRLIILLSDGMGSGGRAAVDSALTVGLAERLLKAGFGFDCTLRLVNSAMLYKSTDESLSTLDISCIDLYSGQTELLKAGAAPTIVRRNGRTGRAECKSLPAGILHEVGFDKAVVTLTEGDVLLMMSDGVCSDGTDWICAEVEAYADQGAKHLSERIATSARRRRLDGHDDDITVFAAVIEKAV